MAVCELSGCIYAGAVYLYVSSIAQGRVHHLYRDLNTARSVWGELLRGEEGCSRVLRRMESYLEITIFWNVTPCSLLWRYCCHAYGERTLYPEDGSSKFHRKRLAYFCSSTKKTLLTRRSRCLLNFVIICQTVRSHSPEDSTRIVVTWEPGCSPVARHSLYSLLGASKLGQLIQCNNSVKWIDQFLKFINKCMNYIA
jgi:hypothetical protein